MAGMESRERERDMSVLPFANRRVLKELKALRKCPPPFAAIEFPNGRDDYMNFHVVISPGEGSDYKGGRSVFRVEISSQEYPYAAPKITCLTPISHPNIDARTGQVVGLFSSWSAADTIEGVIQKLYLLFVSPVY